MGIEEIMRWWPLLVPIVVLELGLFIWALVDLLRRERTKGPKWAWALVIISISLVGPIIYLMLGREE